MTWAYYNEIDPYAAQWLRNLMAAGHIMAGEVDERSIVDVQPDDLAGFTRCHFFAGIAGWDLALRLAGWPDERPVWTGSCPCQPFSSAGKRRGIDDPRHLWPQFFRLIAERRPATVFGEQVASKDGLAWLDLVQADLEGTSYAVGAADLCAAGVGAPHIRQRLWWMADAVPAGRAERRAKPGRGSVAGRVDTGELADADCESESRGRVPRSREGDHEGAGTTCQRPAGLRADGELGDASGARPQARERETVERTGRREEGRAALQPGRPSPGGWSGPTNGSWRDADWLFCRDGKWRPVEPGTFPLAHGIPNRVGSLRGYGNSIVPQVAAEFIGAYLDCITVTP